MASSKLQKLLVLLLVLVIQVPGQKHNVIAIVKQTTLTFFLYFLQGGDCPIY